MNTRRWGIVPLLIFAGCNSPEPSTGSTPNAAVDPNAAQTLQEFTLQDISHGVKTMSLIAESARFYEEDQVAQVDKPTVHFFKKGKETATFFSPSGKVYMTSHNLEAWDGVVVTTSDGATLTTARMRYDAKRQRLMSDDPVRVERPDSVTEGIGFEATPDLNQMVIRRQTVHFKKQR